MNCNEENTNCCNLTMEVTFFPDCIDTPFAIEIEDVNNLRSELDGLDGRIEVLKNAKPITFRIDGGNDDSGVIYFDLDIPISRSANGDWQIDDETLIGSSLRYEIEILPISRYLAQNYGKLTFLLQIDRDSRWIPNPDDPNGNYIEVKDGNIKVQSAYCMALQYPFNAWSNESPYTNLIGNTDSDTLKGRLLFQIKNIYNDNLFQVNAWKNNINITQTAALAMYHKNYIPEIEWDNFHQLYWISLYGIEYAMQSANSQFNSIWNNLNNRQNNYAPELPNNEPMERWRLNAVKYNPNTDRYDIYSPNDNPNIAGVVNPQVTDNIEVDTLSVSFIFSTDMDISFNIVSFANLTNITSEDLHGTWIDNRTLKIAFPTTGDNMLVKGNKFQFNLSRLQNIHNNLILFGDWTQTFTVKFGLVIWEDFENTSGTETWPTSQNSILTDYIGNSGIWRLRNMILSDSYAHSGTYSLSRVGTAELYSPIFAGGVSVITLYAYNPVTARGITFKISTDGINYTDFYVTTSGSSVNTWNKVTCEVNMSDVVSVGIIVGGGSCYIDDISIMAND